MNEERKTGRGWALALVALFLFVYGAKSTLIGAAGSPLPYSDQWNFEALGLYRPYLLGTLDWGQLLAPYNEHRMFFTRLLLLGLFELRGGWDPMLDMLVNGLIGALAGVVYVAIVVPVASPTWRPLVFAFSAFCLALPLGFENTLMGMNSHFYLFILLSLLAVRGMSAAPALSIRWLLGFLCAVLTEFTLASGALTPIAAAFIALLQLGAGVRSKSLREIIGLGLQLVAGVAMILTVSHDAASISLQVRGLGDFLWAAISVASLPLFPVVGLVLVHAPIGWLLLRTWRDRPELRSPIWPVLGIAAWVAAQILAIAYSRYEMALSSRYLDIVVLLLPLDLVALTMLLVQSRRPGQGRWLARAMGTWLFVVVGVTGGAAYFSSWRLAHAEKQQLDAAQPHVTAFLANGNADELQHVASWLYPSMTRLAEILSDPTVRAELPADVRPAGAPDAVAGTVLKGRFANIADGLKTVLSAGLLWLALGAAFAFLAAFRAMLQWTAPPE